MVENYERIIEGYKNWYPNLYERTVECKPCGRYTILVRLDDGSRLEYTTLNDTVRDVSKYYGVNHADGSNEEEWRQEFGRKLRRIMAERGVSQERVSELTGISRQMLTRYVKGTSTPSGYNLTRLSEILDCDVRELTRFDYIEEE